jgi:hypothetical protein
MGAPKSVINLLRSFYADLWLFLVSTETVDPRPLRRTDGILQGCGLAMLMVLLPMSVWALTIKAKHPSVQTGVFVDDRLMWCVNGTDRVTPLREACSTTADFDAKSA